MGRISTSLFLIFWYVIVSIALMGGDNWLTRIVVLVASLPALLFVLYLIWFNSKLPKNRQFRFYNSRWGKK